MTIPFTHLRNHCSFRNDGAKYKTIDNRMNVERENIYEIFLAHKG